jgi:hypothetical protein
MCMLSVLFCFVFSIADARTALGMAASLIFYSLTLLFPHLHVQGSGVGSETAFYHVYGDRVLNSKIANK